MGDLHVKVQVPNVFGVKINTFNIVYNLDGGYKNVVSTPIPANDCFAYNGIARKFSRSTSTTEHGLMIPKRVSTSGWTTPKLPTFLPFHMILAALPGKKAPSSLAPVGSREYPASPPKGTPSTSMIRSSSPCTTSKLEVVPHANPATLRIFLAPTSLVVSSSTQSEISKIFTGRGASLFDPRVFSSPGIRLVRTTWKSIVLALEICAAFLRSSGRLTNSKLS
mmetsp:Transcript_40339/g.48889  ORF Transcript_40339/g.48889 Transcript_40339/m.48889 type:complete len:222 (+) Transcript_40339:131-796(+)